MIQNSRSRDWQYVRSLEDIKALLLRIDARRAIIRKQAWHGTTRESLNAIFDEATAMRAELAELKSAIDTIYQQLFTEVS